MKFNVCVLIPAGFTLFSLAATTLHKTQIYSGPDKLSIALLDGGYINAFDQCMASKYICIVDFLTL